MKTDLDKIIVWRRSESEMSQPQGVVAIMIAVIRSGAVGLSDWLGRFHISIESVEL
jgi:hypothetical protein